MTVEELEQKINGQIESLRKKITALEIWQSAEGKPSVDRFNAASYVEFKDVHKIADEGDDKLERRIKALEDKTKNLKK
jgi:hypothetical protein